MQLQVPHEFQHVIIVMSTKSMPSLTYALPFFKISMSQLKLLGEKSLIIKPWMNLAKQKAPKYYKKMNEINWFHRHWGMDYSEVAKDVILETVSTNLLIHHACPISAISCRCNGTMWNLIHQCQKVLLVMSFSLPLQSNTKCLQHGLAFNIPNSSLNHGMMPQWKWNLRGNYQPNLGTVTFCSSRWSVLVKLLQLNGLTVHSLNRLTRWSFRHFLWWQWTTSQFRQHLCLVNMYSPQQRRQILQNKIRLTQSLWRLCKCSNFHSIRNAWTSWQGGWHQNQTWMKYTQLNDFSPSLWVAIIIMCWMAYWIILWSAIRSNK